MRTFERLRERYVRAKGATVGGCPIQTQPSPGSLELTLFKAQHPNLTVGSTSRFDCAEASDEQTHGLGIGFSPGGARCISKPGDGSPGRRTRCDACDALDLLQQGEYRRGHHILEMRAAEGDAVAITSLGMMYQNGWGVPVNYDRAMGFYQTAAHKGEPLALNQIGFMFLQGLGRPADPKSAWCWFEQTAERGLDKPAHHLAEMMAIGMQPVSCKGSGAKASADGDRRKD